MGHAVGGGFLRATTKEAAMREGLADAEEFAYYNVDREENYGGSYHGNFRFYDRTFDNEDEAMDFFDSLGSYCDGVVMVREPSKSSRTRYQKTVARIREKQKALREKVLENFKSRTSASVGCKKCGTRITGEVALQRNLRCPNCGAWIAPNSAQEKMLGYEKAIEQAEEQLRKDTADTGKPRYWAKYEVHC